MPIYEYECERCRLHFELRQGFNDEPVGTCPECGNAACRVFKPVPLIFKGSGFYITDSRKGNGDGSADKAPEKPAEKDKPTKEAASRETAASK